MNNADVDDDKTRSEENYCYYLLKLPNGKFSFNTFVRASVSQLFKLLKDI